VGLEICLRDKFRRDLYYRLNILYVEIPALRERTEDIPVLMEMMVRKNSPELFDKHKTIWDDFISYFADYSWPGNVRELDNLVKRTCVILLTHGIDKKLMLDIWTRAIGINQPASKIISKTKKIGDALKEVEGNRNSAAEILGISRTTLWRRMKKMKMKDEQRKLELDKNVPLT
jgi:transcriptional regulator with PAS, ATPase and Fis domain